MDRPTFTLCVQIAINIAATCHLLPIQWAKESYVEYKAQQ